MKETKPRDTTSAGSTSRRDRLIFLVLLAVVVILGGLLLFRSRNEPLVKPPVEEKAPTKIWKPWAMAPPTSAPASQPDDDNPPASQPELEPLELPKPPKSNVPLELTPDGKWVPLRRVGARNWTEFQSTPPYRFVSEEEQRRFRDYWVKEAGIRVGIYCEVTDVCPPVAEVNRLLDSLFDDVLPQREEETTDVYKARLERWMDSRRRWMQLFRDTPQSVFSFAGLEQFRGKEQPKPPLEAEQFDAGAEIRRPDDPTKRPKDAGTP